MVANESNEHGNSLPRINGGRATRFLRFIKNIAGQVQGKYKHGRTFVHAFIITEEALRRFQISALRQLNSLKIDADVEFVAVVRFQDLTTRTYDNFDIFLENCANEREPESLGLKWGIFTINEDGEADAAEVYIEFITEKKLLNMDSAPGEYNHSAVLLNLTSTHDTWVTAAFHDLQPHIVSLRLPWFLRWLEIFRNKFFISILQQFSSIVGFSIGYYFTNNIFSEKLTEQKLKLMKDIVDQPDIKSELSKYISYTFRETPGLIWQYLICMLAGALTYGLIYVIVMTLVPKLAPKSAIALGLSAKRANEAMNLLKFIFVDVLILCILIPLILKILHIL
ncbi:MAG: hypothetical protein WDN06_23210 [Asticcacaulis sp.]